MVAVGVEPAAHRGPVPLGSGKAPTVLYAISFAVVIGLGLAWLLKERD
jgi:hypothetical protein